MMLLSRKTSILSALAFSIAAAASVVQDVSSSTRTKFPADVDANSPTKTTEIEHNVNDNDDEEEVEETSSSVSPAFISKSSKKRLTEESMNPSLRRMEYAVRGSVVVAADRINDELKQVESQQIGAAKKYPFDKIVYTNIGNPQSIGQQPLTWPRQVLALVDLPAHVGIDHPDVHKLFPADVIRRAREIQENALNGYGSGAYSHSKGVKTFREDVCTFLQKRDGEEVPTNPEDIFLSNGASAAITNVLQALIADPSCGVMIPIPQYPIYSATLDLLNGQKVGYYLEEDHKWDLNMEELERSLAQAQSEGTNVVGLVMINPGNPTGSVLSKKAVQDLVRFCSRHNLVLLADEVYQENVYDDNAEFYSAKRAAYDTGLLQSDSIELVSFHSTSKGVFGECGRRGGYMELCGIDEKVKEHMYKLASASLCSTVSGQIMTSLMVRGPEPGDESYESHEAEKSAVFESLKRRAIVVGTGLNSIPGFSCQPAQGAMYCFPAIQIPKGAIEEASAKGMSPDTMYAVSLLQNTGICVVPASGFGQKPGRFGFRTTFLPPEDQMAKCVEGIKQHHQEFCSRYGD